MLKPIFSEKFFACGGPIIFRKLEGGGRGVLSVAREFSTPVNKTTFYTKICQVKMKLLDLFDFCTKLYFCIFDHFLQTYNYLQLKFVNFMQKLTLFTGVQNSTFSPPLPPPPPIKKKSHIPPIPSSDTQHSNSHLDKMIKFPKLLHNFRKKKKTKMQKRYISCP